MQRQFTNLSNWNKELPWLHDLSGLTTTLVTWHAVRLRTQKNAAAHPQSKAFPMEFPAQLNLQRLMADIDSFNLNPDA
jgi:hypothetical protein